MPEVSRLQYELLSYANGNEELTKPVTSGGELLILSLIAGG